MESKEDEERRDLLAERLAERRKPKRIPANKWATANKPGKGE